MESDIEENIDPKKQIRINNLTDPISVRDAASKNLFRYFFNDPSILKNTGLVDIFNRNLDNVRFVKVTSYPAVGEQLTTKNYVDEAVSNSVDESLLLRLEPGETLEQYSIPLNSTLTTPVR